MKRNKFKTFITTNTWLKLISLALAIVLWLFVVSKGRSVIVMDIPVGLMNLPSNLEIIEKPKTISVSIEGQERLLKKLRKEDITAVINLSQVKEGENLLSLSMDDIGVPKLLTVKKISPQTIQLQVDERIEKSIHVRPIVVGSPASGFSVREVKVEPKTIRITGPKSVVSRIYTVKTEPIDISGISNNLYYGAMLNMSVENVTMDISEVEVNVSVTGTAK